MKLTQASFEDAREFQKIQEFAAACRRQWPDAKIVLRPNEDDASSGADARPHAPETAPGVIVMSAFDNDLLTPTEADLDVCYGSKFLSATDLGDRKLRTKIGRVRMEELRQQDGKTRKKFILGFVNLDKEVVLNATNKTTLVDALGRTPADWIGAEIGLLTEPTMMAGKPTRGLRVRVLNKPVTAVQPPKPAPAAAATAEAPPWLDQPGDPGPSDFTDFDGEAVAD
jgi:hypothetical protein